MRRPLRTLALSAMLVPGLVAIPVLDVAADPAPVAPRIQTLELAGVDTAALAEQRHAAASRLARAAVEPAVLTSRRPTKPFDVLGVTWDGRHAQDVRVEVRIREGGSWTGWQALDVIDEGPDAGTEEADAARTGTSPLLSQDADGVQVRVHTPTGKAPAGLRVDLIDPGSAPADEATPGPAATADAAGDPAVITRKEWGADERLVKGEHHVNQTVKALVLHHTAGSNSYSQAQAFEEIRGIYAYHTKSLGWADIGYNLLVDRYGRIFEGRRGSLTAAVRGAHAGGFNTDTYGISVMGDFEAVQPPQAVIDAMSRAAAWKAGQYGLNLKGSTMLVSQGGGTARYAAGTAVTVPKLMGHRDVGKTACPGRHLYPYLDDIAAKAMRQASTYPLINWPAFPRAWDGNRRADVLASDPAGRLWLYPGSGTGGFAKRSQIGRGWGAMGLVTQVGDVDGDRKPDVVARRNSTGELWLYPGNGRGGFLTPRKIGTGWGVIKTLLGPGDWDGDGHGDLLAIDTSGYMRLYGGNGKGRFSYTSRPGRGWQVMDLVTAVGDIDSSGTPDVLARRPTTGELLLYSGDGYGGFDGARVLGRGWGPFTALYGPGDWNGSGGHDFLARRSDGALFLYAGNGLSKFPSRQVGSGWKSYSMIG